MDPETSARSSPASASADGLGLGNVDERLRQVFGDDYGLVVETAPGAGTKVTFRVPKYAPGVHAEPLRPRAAARRSLDGMPATSTSADAPLRALVVDDEAPALAELVWLLGQDARIGECTAAASGTEALRALEEQPVDVVFCDIKMPGLDGLDLARVLARFAEPPAGRLRHRVRRARGRRVRAGRHRLRA